MGVNYYIDKVSIVFEKVNMFYNKKEIDDKLFNHIQNELNKKTIKRIEAENVEDMISIAIFIDDKQFHLGIIDMYNEINYYLDNLSNDLSLVDISGNCFEKRFVCSNFQVLWNVFMKFSTLGEISHSVHWYTEE